MLVAEQAVREIPLRPHQTAHAVRLHLAGLQALAQCQLGGSTADIDDQPFLVRGGQLVGDTLVNQPGFFATGYHVNGEPQNLGGAGQEHVAIPGFAQGLRGDCPHLVALEAGKTFPKTRQAVPAGLHGLRGQVTVFVESTPLPHRLFEVFRPNKFLVIDDPDFEAKAVRAEIYRGETLFWMHWGR